VRAVNQWTLYAFPDQGLSRPLASTGVVVASKLTVELLDAISGGAKALINASPAGGSLDVQNRWTLRGSVWLPPHPLVRAFGREALIDLLVHDLHPTGMIPLKRLFDVVDPIVSFWDTHDIPRVDDYGFVFETGVGQGRLLVSTLPTDGSVAARALQGLFVEHLREGAAPERALPAPLIAAMRDRLAAKTLDLAAREDWKLRPEPEGGPPGAWRPIRVGAHWEGQGLPDLDGRARYRLELELPADWTGKPLFVSLDGADDAYEVRFDDAPRGAGGDRAKRATAFDLRASHRLAESLAAGPHVLEFVVDDWQGAGGLHRPLRLSTAALDESADFLKLE
jgi:hypothetical protein